MGKEKNRYSDSELAEFKAIIEKIDSTLPAAPNKCPIDDLVELTLTLSENKL